MKKKLMGITIAIFSLTVMLTSCNGEDLSSKSPLISEKDSEVFKQIQSLLQKDAEEITFDEIDQVDLNDDGRTEYIVKYKTKKTTGPSLRIAVITSENEKLVVKDVIKNVGEDFVEIAYIDINSDNNKEIIAGFKAGENLSKGISIYEFKQGRAVEVLEEYYTEYIVKDIDEDDREDVILIKENEKDGKSYAYLYMWQREGFKKVKKVEIDSTSDSKADIFEKLLEAEINQ